MAPSTSVGKKKNDDKTTKSDSTFQKGKVKRKWKYKHEKAFIGNKHEGQGYADRRKKKIMYEYRKLKKKERQELKHKGNVNNQQTYTQTDVTATKDPSSQITEQETIGGSHNEMKVKRKKTKPFVKEQLEFQRKQEEKETRIQEAQKQKDEMDKALKEYQRKKKENHRKFSKKTRRGQPIMKYRIEDLLEKIKKQ
ncbi:uncharacterized protein LOC144448563 [Glandiceps talaboti]